MPNLFIERPSYKDETPDHFKTAGAEIKLGPDPNNWPEEILREAFKSIPALKDYTPNVEMQHVDADNLVGYGALVISTHGDPNSPSPYTRTVHIPVLIQGGKLKPMDMLIKPGEPGTPSEAMPLTERRLRSALFRPDTYDIAAPLPSQGSLANALYPPARDGYNGTGSMMGMSGMGKMGSVDALDLALQGAHPSDVQQLRQEMLKHAEIYRANPEALPALRKVAAFRPTSRQEVFTSKIAGQVPTTVLQITSLGDGTYQAKSASALAWAPETHRLSRAELVKMASPEQMADLDLGGEVTMGAGEGVSDDGEPKKLKAATVAGLYKAHTLEGDEVVGLIFPNLIDIDGVKGPTSLFTNGSSATYQPSIAGEMVSAVPANMTGNRGPNPREGLGIWVGHDGEGEFEATVPFQLQGGVGGMSGQGYMVENPAGEAVIAQIMPSLQKIECIDGNLLIPGSYSWMSLSKASAGPLKGEEDGSLLAQKVASTASKHLLLSSHGDTFALQGAAVDKLASDQRHNLDPSEALFLLIGAGVDPSYATTKLAEARRTRSLVKLATRWDITPLEQQVDSYLRHSDSVAVKVAGGLPRVSLVKEAGYLGDADSIDSLLSLNLLNPENLSNFVEMIPSFESLLRNLCDLLLASRLGLQEVPSTALEKAVQGLDRTLEGLYSLRFQEPGTEN